MLEWNDEAVVLRRGIFREADIWLKILCREHGLFTVFAFGGARSKKRFCGCLDVLNSLHCRIKISGKGNFFNLQEAALLEGPRNLRANWRNMGMAANCMRFLEAMHIGPDNSGECYAILEDLRSRLECRTETCGLLPVLFRLRIATATGFGPNLEFCPVCGATKIGHGVFLASEGQIFCSCCLDAGFVSRKNPAHKISGSGLDFLRFVKRAMPSQWDMDKLDAESLRDCARLVDGFVQYHLGLEWKNGAFRPI